MGIKDSQGLYGVVNALHWKNSKRQISIHQTVLKHQNTKTSLHKLSKNHWVFALFLILGSLRKKLQSTLVAGAWTEREKMYHGGSFLKLADDNMDIQNPEAQNRELSGF